LCAPSVLSSGSFLSGVSSLAAAWSVSEADIIDALEGSDGHSVALKTLEGVLRACFSGLDWLHEAEGRGGVPLSVEEAGLDIGFKVKLGTDGIIVEGRAHARSKKKWWSRV